MIHISKITEGDRARTDFGDVRELAESLLRLGFIHPIALDKNKQLVAGGRRFKALSSLWEKRDSIDRDTVEDPTMVRFLDSGNLELGVHYTSKEESDLAACDEMELEENVRRKAFTWKEEVIAICKIHRRKRKGARERKEQWGLRNTGSLLGVSHAKVQYALKIYEALQDPEHPIQDCSSATDALHKLVEIQAEKARRLAVKQNVVVKPKKGAPGVELDLDDLTAGLKRKALEPVSDDEDGDFDYEPFEIGADGAVKIVHSGDDNEKIGDVETVTISLEKFKHGDFLALLESGELAEGSVNHILTDPPYGIEMSNLQYAEDKNNIDRIADTHDVDSNVANFEPWLHGFWRVMKPDGFCVVWCDFAHFQNLVDLAKQIGFKPQRWPFVWCKTHTCMNQMASHNFTKNFEIALVLRKGSATLVRPQGTSYFLASSQAVRNQITGHPFVKPLELWMHLAQAIALDGEKILDPFAGAGSMPLALIERYDVHTCEINEDIYNQQLLGIMQHYRSIFPKVEFVK